MLTLFSEGQTPALYNRYPKLNDDQLDQVDDLADEVGKGVLSSGGFPLVLGLAVGLGVAGVSGAPIVGAAAGGYFIYSAIQGALTKGKAAQYIRDKGCLAHCLTEAQLIRYAEIVGPDAVVAELQQAYRDGEQVSSAGKRFARSLGVELKRRTIANFVAELEALKTVPDESTKPVSNQASDDPQTNAQQAIEPHVQASPDDPHPTVSNEVVDLPLGLAGRFKPTVITARPRVGKSLAISHAMARLKADGVSIWIIQPKPSPQELGYWKHADRFLGFWAEKCPQDDEAMVAKLNQFIDEWRAQQHRPTLLFIDEGLMLEAKFPKWFKQDLRAQIVVEGSSGETDRRVLWIATQSPLVTDLGLTTGKRSAFDMVTLQKPDTLDHAFMVRSSYKSMQGLPDRPDFALSPVGVLVYHSAAGSWVGVDRLPVPSIEPGDQLCPELEAMARPSYSVVTSAPKIEPSSIDDELPMLYQAVARMAVSQAHAEIDPAMDLIESIPNAAKRDALLIAYRWAQGRIENGKNVDREAFLNRAKNERRCQYLLLHRDDIWEELDVLLDQ